MPEDRHYLLAWTLDLVIAYAAGLAVGAPLAAVAAMGTGVDGLATVALLVAMGAVLLWRRRARTRALTRVDAGASRNSSSGTRRAA